MRSSPLILILFGAVVLLTTSCLRAEPVNEEKMLGLSAALTKVSASVHSAVAYKGADPRLQDGDLLSFATAHNPSLLNVFEGYVLKARQNAKTSSVLVCDQKGQTALIEDAGCTAKLDQPLWKTNPNRTCDYVLDLTATCAVP